MNIHKNQLVGILVILFGALLYLCIIHPLEKYWKSHNANSLEICPEDISGRNAVVISKKLDHIQYNSYSIKMEVKINDTIYSVKHPSSIMYDTYNVGDTIKYIGVKYE